MEKKIGLTARVYSSIVYNGEHESGNSVIPLIEHVTDFAREKGHLTAALLGKFHSIAGDKENGGQKRKRNKREVEAHLKEC